MEACATEINVTLRFLDRVGYIEQHLVLGYMPQLKQVFVLNGYRFMVHGIEHTMKLVQLNTGKEAIEDNEKIVVEMGWLDAEDDDGIIKDPELVRGRVAS